MDIKEFDKIIAGDRHIEELMKPVAQVALSRLENMGGVLEADLKETAKKIITAARAGLLRVRNMAHPKGGRLVHEWRNLDDIAVPLELGCLSGVEGAAGQSLNAAASHIADASQVALGNGVGVTSRAVPDVYVLRWEAAGLEPWESGAGLGRESGEGAGSDVGGYSSFGRQVADILNHSCVTQLAWDDTGRIVSKAEFLSAPLLYEYEYDQVGRLAKAWRNGFVAERYEYDGKARSSMDLHIGRGERSYSYSQDDRLLEAGATRCIYDENGALAVKWPGAGAVGPLRLEHDRGRVVSVAVPDAGTVRYVYDGSGRRVQRLVDGELHWEYEWLDQLRLATVRDVRMGVAVSFVYGVDGEENATRVPLFVDVKADDEGKTDAVGNGKKAAGQG